MRHLGPVPVSGRASSAHLAPCVVTKACHLGCDKMTKAEQLAERSARLTVFAWPGGGSARQVRVWRRGGCRPCRGVCRVSRVMPSVPARIMPRTVWLEGGVGGAGLAPGGCGDIIHIDALRRRLVGVPRNSGVRRWGHLLRPAPSHLDGSVAGAASPGGWCGACTNHGATTRYVCGQHGEKGGRFLGRAGRCCRNSAWKKLVHSSEREYMTWVQDHGGRFCGDAWLLEPRPTGALAARPVARVTVSSARTSPTGDLGRAPYRVA